MKQRGFRRQMIWALALVSLLAASIFFFWGEWRKHQEQERVKSVASHSFKVRSIDPHDDDFSDLQPLIDIIGQRRFVLMGETTHDDGATFAARTRLIRFLHRKLGFDVIALEDSYVSMRALSASLKSEDLYRRFLADHPTQVTLAKQRALIDFIHVTQVEGDRPVALMGNHVHYFGDTDLVSRIQAFIAHLPSQPFSEPQARRFESLLTSILGVDSHTGAAKLGQMTRDEAREIEVLSSSLATAIAEQRTALVRATSGEEVAYFEGLVGSLPGFAAYATMHQPFQVPRDREQLSIRDKAMAELIIHASRQLYPGRKMVITAANAHLLRTTGDFEPMRGVASMGEHLYRAFGDETFTIVFEAYSGSAGNSVHAAPIPPASPNTLAHLFHQIGDDFRFLDLHGLPANHWLRWDRIGVRAQSYFPDGQSTVWPNVVDGIFYIDQQQPVTEHSAEKAASKR